ncbi:MAG: cation:proton antiporter [bacterium]|nr:cation:proton antiporter [bacterium]MDT8395408.1 cation:proton antiporter [bacterium]
MTSDPSNVHPLLYLGILLLAGYAGGRMARAINLPRLTGYILVGMALSPSLTGILDRNFLDHGLALVTDIALGIIAFTIGGALELDRIRKLGRQILVITMFESLSAFVLVSLAAAFLYPLFHSRELGSPATNASVALLLGAMCVATAPAAVLGVIHEYKAKGPMTTTILGVVTLDDGVALVLFSVASGIAGSLGGGDASWVRYVFLEPGREIGLSLAIGGTMGLFFKLVIPTVRRKMSLLGISLGAIFTASGLALTFHASPLLTCMMLGFVMANIMNHPEQWFEAVERVEEPVMAMFFVVAGAHLDISAITTAGGLAAIITTMRAFGKYSGGFLGAVASGASLELRRYLPMGLLPQAGVSIGLVLAAKEFIPDPQVAGVMVNAVLASVIVNELVSPVLVRFALTKAGEVGL